MALMSVGILELVNLNFSVFCKVFKLRKFYEQYDNLDDKRCFVGDIDSCLLRGW